MLSRLFLVPRAHVADRPAASVWGSKLPFNTICGEYASPAGGWVHAVGFSPSGDVLAFASKQTLLYRCPNLIRCTGHDSSISIVYPGGPTIYNIRISSLPFVTLTWTAEDTIVAAGHDCQPVVFSGSEGGWQGVGSLDDSTTAKATSPRSGFGGNSSVGRLNSTAFSTFRDADTRGHTGSSATLDTKLLTVHQNTITSVRPYESKGGRVVKVSTSGVDGNLVIWDADNVSAVTGRMGGMRM